MIFYPLKRIKKEIFGWEPIMVLTVITQLAIPLQGFFTKTIKHHYLIIPFGVLKKLRMKFG